MSKFLKFIVHLVILLAVLDVLALAVPPFLGVNTAIMDSAVKESNLPIGSVTYAKPVSVNELQTGDSVLVQDADSIYRYKINSIDDAQGVFNVYDQTDVEAGEKPVKLTNTAPKVIITIGLIGYLIIATQSIEGLIILGLIVLFLIILFILAELWRKDKRYPDAGELEGADEDAMAAVAASLDEDEMTPKTKKQLKKEMKARVKEDALLDKQRAKQELEEATRQLKAEAKARKKAEKLNRKEAKKRARTGGFIEDYDPIEAKLEEQEKAQKATVNPVDYAADAAKQELKKEIAAATAPVLNIGETQEVALEKNADLQENSSAVEIEQILSEVFPEESGAEGISEEDIPVMEAELAAEAVEPEPEISFEPEEEMPPEPVELKKMAVPVFTEEELLSNAQAAGDAPQVLRDEKVGVTLLDYSDIILEESPSEEEH